MADLISRAVAIAQIKENYCDWCDHTDLCQSCETRDCIATIEQQVPAVDAIPVEWMRDKMRGYASALKSTETAALVRVMQMWQKEQEAQK